jgi:outer membrane protein assembly factor BamB
LVVGAVAAVAALVVGIVAVGSGGGDSSDGGGGSGSGGGGDGDGWVVPEHGNSFLLSARDDLACSTDGGSVFCVDPASGEDRFTAELDRGLATPPALLDDRVLIASSGAITGDLYAFSLDGERLWRESYAIDAELDMPVVGDVLVAIEDGELVGIDVADGEEAWRSYVPADNQDGRLGDNEGPQAVGDDVFTDGTLVYLPIETIDVDAGPAEPVGNIVAVDPATGREVWRSDVLGDIGFGVGIADAAPFVEGGAVAFLMEGTPRRIVVLDTADGRMRWESPIASEYSNIVDAGGMTIVADGPDMRALDRDGGTAWEVPSPVIERSPSLLGPGELVVDHDRLFIAGVDVLEVDPASGESELLRPDVNATDVAIAADLLVIAGISDLEAVPLPSGDGD